MAIAENKEKKVLNVPNLRFPEFQGEWVVSRLSEYLNENKERNKKGLFNKTDVLSVSGDFGIVNQIDLLGRSFAGASVLPYHVVRLGNIVYTKSPLKEYPYGIVKANTGKVGIVSTLYAVYSVNDNANDKFIEYYFSLANRANRYFKPIVRIGAKHDMKIGNQEVLANQVVFPTVKEQEKIADFLSLIDERISTQNKIIEDLKTLKSAIIDYAIGSLDTNFMKFGSVYETAGEGGTPTTSNTSFYDNGKIPFIKIGDLKQKYLIENKDFITELGLQKSSAWLVPTHSILFSNGATIGEITITTYPVCTKQGILGIVPKANIDVEFLYYFMSSSYFKKAVSRIITEGTMKTAYLKDIDNILCPIPTKEKQLEIAKVPSALNFKIDSEQSILRLLYAQKQYLLHQMFR